MNKGYLRLIVRFLRRNKTYSILNFVCLSFGLTCSIIALLYIQNLLNHDKFNKNYDRLYSVNAIVTYFNGDRFPKAYVSASLDDVIRTASPEIDEVSRVVSRDYSFVSGDKSFTENGIYADSNFFRLFTYKLIRGDIKSALNTSNTIVLTENLALKLFGNSDCVGKPVTIKDGPDLKNYNVTGVLKNVTDRSVFDFEFVIPFNDFLSANRWATESGATANQIWVLLGINAEKDKVNNKLRDLIKTQETTLNQELFLFPLGEEILYSYANGKRVWKEMQNIVIVGCIGFAILLIACFNFINLSVAMNIKRYREAGIKKVVGATRSAIVLQYLGETLFITILSLACAAIITDALLFVFNRMFNAGIQLSLLSIDTISFFIAVTLFTAFVSGLIPALYLSSSDPINILKGKAIKNHSFSTFRQVLIVFQFTIPVVLIVGMLIIRTQDDYIRNYNIGVDRDKIIVLNNSKNINDHLGSVKTELLNIPGIETVSFTNCIPTQNANITSDVNWPGRNESEKLDFWCINTDFDYNRVVDIRIISGRFFSQAFLSDSTGYVINDIAAKVIGNTDPVGSLITVDGEKGQVLGVFHDFHTIDLSGPLVPTIIRIKPGLSKILLIKYSSGIFLLWLVGLRLFTNSMNRK